MCQAGKPIETGSRLVVSRGSGDEGEREQLLIGMCFYSVWGDQSVLELDGGDDCTIL